MKKLICGIISCFNNRAREIYQTRFVVDAARAKYIKAQDSLKDMKRNVIEAKAQLAVLEKKSKTIADEIAKTKSELKKLAEGNKKINPAKFAQLKATLDAKNEQLTFVNKSKAQYQAMADKLDSAIAKSQAICQALLYKIETLTQKQSIIKNLGNLNTAMMETDPALADDQLETAQIDDQAEKELAKFEILAENEGDDTPASDADMKAFIKSL